METLEEKRWRAVSERDAAMGALFVYAVRTTGVYCRPGCGSRRALRANVEFFSTPEEAEGAGYRPCRRCRPEVEHAVDPTIEAAIFVCRHLEDRDGDHDVASLASDLGYSERHLRRLFAQVVGVSMSAYLRAQQATRARDALRSGKAVTEALFDAGYGSNRAFYEHGATRLGMSPGRYRDGGRDESISFTTIETPIGVVVVARTPHGVCSVKVGDDEVALIEELTNEFPLASIERDDDGLFDVAAVLALAVRGERDSTSLPLDVAGTAFQIRVWEALRAIPMGETRTYSQVAASIGAPKSVRAVGSACAANPVALTIPCHRVVRRDGSLGGYRWGLDAKASLLSAEAS